MKFWMLVLALLATLASCEQSTETKSTEKKDVGSILVEAVDAETYGERAGDTHFSLGLHELSYSYENFDSAEKSLEKLRERSDLTGAIIEKGDIKNGAGVVIGSYRLARINSTSTDQEFCLLWSKSKRYAKVCSKSIEGIEQFRSEYEL